MRPAEGGDSYGRGAAADKSIVTAPRVPLFHFDAGWLFIVAGLAVCIVGALASADRELQTLRVQQSLLKAEEEYAYARLQAHEEFLQQLENPDAALTRRLAAQELNLMPADEEPVLRLITLELPTVEWVDRAVERPSPKPVHANRSLLTELATGEYRLWVFGGGVFCVFLGLLMDQGANAARKRSETRAVAGAIPREELGIELKPTRVTTATEPALAFEWSDGAREDAEPECLSSHFEIEDAMSAGHDRNEGVGAALGDEIEDESEIETEEGIANEDAAFDDAADEATLDEDLEQYELVAGDVELVEVEELVDDALGETGEADDPFAMDESAGEERGGESVISIRPAMSVGAPEEDELGAVDEREGADLLARASGEVAETSWDDDGLEEDVEAETAARARGSKSKRSHKRR